MKLQKQKVRWQKMSITSFGAAEANTSRNESEVRGQSEQRVKN